MVARVTDDVHVNTTFGSVVVLSSPVDVTRYDNCTIRGWLVDEDTVFIIWGRKYFFAELVSVGYFSNGLDKFLFYFFSFRCC